jgi:hypothetical protein
MSHHTHQTAPTQFLEANGVRFAFRRFGKAAGIPLVFNQHYLGTMDYWDPTCTDLHPFTRDHRRGGEHEKRREATAQISQPKDRVRQHETDLVTRE